MRYTLATAYSNIGWVINQVPLEICTFFLYPVFTSLNLFHCCVKCVFSRMLRCAWYAPAFFIFTSGSITVTCVEIVYVKNVVKARCLLVNLRNMATFLRALIVHMDRYYFHDIDTTNACFDVTLKLLLACERTRFLLKLSTHKFKQRQQNYWHLHLTHHHLPLHRMTHLKPWF